MLEQQGLTATEPGGSCREEAAARCPRHGRPKNRGLCRQTAGEHLKGFKRFERLKDGKRQA